ncbi:MAG: FKBP-type peptidyl-prolyl cis-trans isomerase [Sphingosinicella sp.]|nr:FKBP-type peptidyl-prolyl cis-trans isomerase [Sphingosinicella sp.]
MSVTAVPIRPIKKGSLVKLWAGLAALSLAILWLAYQGTESLRTGDPRFFLAQNGKRDNVVTTASGLQYEVLRKGSGPRPGATDIVTFNYVGRLADGTIFDESAKQGGPATAPVFGVVPGVSEALQLMNKGSAYRIWMPPELGYGPQGSGDTIPPDSMLEFDLDLVDFRSLTPEEEQRIQMQMMQMMQQQGGGGQPTG